MPPAAARTAEAAEKSSAEARQRAYALSRRQWAYSVGRPYDTVVDLRPPPGELDVGADE